jgi:hypothetical protein
MDINILIEALELDNLGDWEAAHRIVQHYETPEANWIHAYLHRKEGDAWNANYWYDKANRVMPTTKTLDEEWEEIMAYMTNLV